MAGLGIVTGGAQGIGAAIVSALLDQGVVDRVAVFDLFPETMADQDERVSVHGCDVTDEESVRAAYGAVGEVPMVLVNNAGGGRLGEIRPADGEGEAATEPPSAFDPFAPVDAFRDMVELNFTSAHVVTRVIGPDLQAGAAICNTASIAGQRPTALYSYGAAKAALIHWTMSMARALAPAHIRVNAVAPGIIRTRLWEAMQPDEVSYDTMIKDIMPMSEDQKPSDIANAVAFLCSDRASQITGEVIRIDGGLTLR
ncbi:MAG: SDR family oxidoreductase [Actinomycetia bacterium]|nr:SDR family oxidoreductase [Actinomycetes bacterium]MCP4225374.1 SDR family oxidoreductase [Actinomycetes bacterium]MCP5034529.1 SDR family oxidoreductase [Actinomycetes bacterium]